MAEFVLRLRDRELSRTQIRNTRITLGRDLGSDVVIDNPSVSRTHAIMIYVDEKFRIRDDSANGMTVNGKQTKDSLLNYGDVIGIGKFEIVLQPSAEAVPMQTGSHAKAGAPKNVIGTLAMDPAAAAKMRDDAIAANKQAAAVKQAANRQSLVSAQEDTLRPPPPKAGAEAPAVAAAPAAVVAAAHAAEVAPVEPPSSDARAVPHAVAPSAVQAAAAAVPARKARYRPKPMGVDVIAVLQLAGLGLLLIVAGLATALWMLQHGKL